MNLALLINVGPIEVHRLCILLRFIHVSLCPACYSALRELDLFPEASKKLLCDIKQHWTCHNLVPLGISESGLRSNITELRLYKSFYWLEAFSFRDVQHTHTHTHIHTHTHTHTHTKVDHTAKCCSLVLSNISQWIIILATVYQLLSSFSQITLVIKICIRTETTGKLALKWSIEKNETSEQTIVFFSQFFNTVLVDRR